MNKILRIGLFLLIILMVLAIGVTLVKRKQKVLQQVPAHSNRARPVTVATVESGDLTVKNHYLGLVEAVQTARITARVTAPVETIQVYEGDRVEAGDTLAQLDAREIQQNILEAEARIQQARAEQEGRRATVDALEVSHRYWQAELKRQQTLAEQGTIPKTDADLAGEKAAEVEGRLLSTRQSILAIESQLDALARQKEGLETRLGYHRIASPFAGLVSRRAIDVGDLAAPNAVVFEIQDHSQWKITFDVPQKDLPTVHRESMVRFDLNGSPHSRPIQVLHPSLDARKMMRAEIRVAPQDVPTLVAGAYLPLRVVVSQFNDVALLPAAAVISGPDGQDHVFAITGEDTLSPRPVEVLGRSGDRVAVRGIEPGARVVRNSFLGWTTLSAGEKVEAVQ